MSKNNVDIYTIVHKKTGKIWTAKSGKSSWKSTSAAKNAWANSYHTYYYYNYDEVLVECKKAMVDPVPNPKKYDFDTFPYFDQQDQWEVVKMEVIPTAQLKRAVELLERWYNLGDEIVDDVITDTGAFLNETMA